MKNIFYLIFLLCIGLPTNATETTSTTFTSMDDIIKRGNSFIIHNVELFNGTEIISSAAVVVKKGMIVKVCTANDESCLKYEGEKIDGKGQFLMPSLIDSEGHFSRPSDVINEVNESEKPFCQEGKTLRPDLSLIFAEFVKKELLTEVNTHGLYQTHGAHPQKMGDRVSLPPEANYEKHIRFGVTTVLDMGAYPWPANYVKRSRDKWRSEKTQEDRDLRKEFLIYADLFTAGMWASPANLQFGYFGTDPVYNVKPEGPWSDAQVLAWVKRRKVEGSDHVKVFYDDWRKTKGALVMSARTVKALVKAAHQEGLMVFSHNQSVTSAQDLINAKVDGQIHTPIDYERDEVNDELITRIAKGIKYVTVTLSATIKKCTGEYRSAHILRNYFFSPDVLPYVNALDELRLAHCSNPKPKYPHQQTQYFKTVAKLADAGAILQTGTDAEDMSPMIEGLTVHNEMYLIREALDQYSEKYKGARANLEALKAATSNASQAYKLNIENGAHTKYDPRGFIKPGYRADLLLLRESPMKDILNTLKIVRVWKAGYQGRREMVRPECAKLENCPSQEIIKKAQAMPCKD